MSKSRKKYSPEKKVALIKKHLVEKIPISDICDKHGLHPTVFHRWIKTFFEQGSRAFEKQNSAYKNNLEKKVAELENKLTKKNEVLSELMEEHVALKKVLGNSK